MKSYIAPKENDVDKNATVDKNVNVDNNATTRPPPKPPPIISHIDDTNDDITDTDDFNTNEIEANSQRHSCISIDDEDYCLSDSSSDSMDSNISSSCPMSNFSE